MLGLIAGFNCTFWQFWSIGIEFKGSLLMTRFTFLVVYWYTAHCSSSFTCIACFQCAFAQIAKNLLSISSCLRPSVRMYHRGFHCTDFRQIRCLRFLRKFVYILQIWLKSDKNIGRFARILVTFVLLTAVWSILQVDDSARGVHYCVPVATLIGFILLTATCMWVVQRECMWLLVLNPGAYDDL
jgi:hypothetical protein